MESRFIILLLIPRVVYCLDLEAKDEQTFPNGTLVGTYSYFDSLGNKVKVYYFADRDNYCVQLKGSKIPEDENLNLKSIPETTAIPTMTLDKMVPLKLNLPVIENLYTIKNKENITNNGREITSRLESGKKPIDYEIYDPVVDTSKRGKKKYSSEYNFIRKIRKALDSYSGKISRVRN